MDSCIIVLAYIGNFKQSFSETISVKRGDLITYNNSYGITAIRKIHFKLDKICLAISSTYYSKNIVFSFVSLLKIRKLSLIYPSPIMTHFPNKPFLFCAFSRIFQYSPHHSLQKAPPDFQEIS